MLSRSQLLEELTKEELSENLKKHKAEGTQSTECLCDHSEHAQWGFTEKDGRNIFQGRIGGGDLIGHDACKPLCVWQKGKRKIYFVMLPGD